MIAKQKPDRDQQKIITMGQTHTIHFIVCAIVNIWIENPEIFMHSDPTLYVLPSKRNDLAR